MHRRRVVWTGRRFAGGSFLVLLLALVPSGCVERVSVSGSGAQGNDAAPTNVRPAISWGGRFVAFVSQATNLVRDDTNGVPDVFVRDRRERVTERVNVSSSGEQANHGTYSVISMSPGGRFVVFDSVASNLASDEASGVNKVYLHDRRTGTTERISKPGFVDSAGYAGVAVSRRGRYVAFDDLGSTFPTLVPDQVFVRDRSNGTLDRVDVDSDERPFTAADGSPLSTFGPAMSADGRWVAFKVSAVRGATSRPVDEDIVLRDRQAGTSTTLRRVSSVSGPVPPTISADGRFIAFEELLAFEPGRFEPLLASFGIRIHDRVVGTSQLIAPASNESLRYPSLSPDGRYLAMRRGPASGSLPVTQIVVRDLQTGAVELVSENLRGEPGNGPSLRPATSALARFTAFNSLASDLVPGDSNGQPDVFVAGR